MVQRISVVGTSGSGKSSLARRIADVLGVEPLELDALYHQANWTPMETVQFRAAVQRHVDQPTWVVDGNYHAQLEDIVWKRADAIVFFDLPRPRVILQLVRRSLVRSLIGMQLWNGNRESLRNLFSLDPQRSVVINSWITHPEHRARIAEAQSNETYRYAQFFRVLSHREGDAFVESLAACQRRPSGKAGR